MAIPPGLLTKIAKTIAAGLWAGAVLASALAFWNANRFAAEFPSLQSKAMLDSFVACALAAPVGWLFWAGYILKG